jgi:hypothetical protein
MLLEPSLRIPLVQKITLRVFGSRLTTGTTATDLSLSPGIPAPNRSDTKAVNLSIKAAHYLYQQNDKTFTHFNSYFI